MSTPPPHLRTLPHVPINERGLRELELWLQARRVTRVDLSGFLHWGQNTETESPRQYRGGLTLDGDGTGDFSFNTAGSDYAVTTSTGDVSYATTGGDVAYSTVGGGYTVTSRGGAVTLDSRYTSGIGGDIALNAGDVSTVVGGDITFTTTSGGQIVSTIPGASITMATAAITLLATGQITLTTSSDCDVNVGSGSNFNVVVLHTNGTGGTANIEADDHVFITGGSGLSGSAYAVRLDGHGRSTGGGGSSNPGHIDSYPGTGKATRLLDPSGNIVLEVG